MDFKEASEKSQNSQTDYHDLAYIRMWLAGHYAYLGGLLGEILTEKPVKWNLLRDNVKSDTAAERKWQATEDGVKEMRLRIEMKSTERLMSAIKTRIEIATNERYNL